MIVEIWSDVVCPFCYMGKRKFEIALEQFQQRDEVEVIWHSFQLDSAAKRLQGKDIHDYLAAKYGRDREWAKERNGEVAARAKEVGLEYNFDKAIPVNTFDAHRFIHLAAAHGLQGKAEERLFAAYFTEGKDISDHGALAQLGNEIGLDPGEVRTTLASTDYADSVKGDIEEAESLGINSVPFFVFNRKYAVAGAQPSHLFLETIHQVWEEEHPVEEGPKGSADQ
jgi:predicted DsbA family dithiol-disulfide isomerase